MGQREMGMRMGCNRDGNGDRTGMGMAFDGNRERWGYSPTAQHQSSDKSPPDRHRVTHHLSLLQIPKLRSPKSLHPNNYQQRDGAGLCPQA